MTEGFSRRFNEYLDEQGITKKNRARRLSEKFDISLSGARRWLIQDQPPKNKALMEIVEKLSPENNALHTVIWLLYGVRVGAAKCSEASPQLRGNVFREVISQLNQLNIEPENIDAVRLARAVDLLITAP